MFFIVEHYSERGIIFLITPKIPDKKKKYWMNEVYLKTQSGDFEL